MNFLTKILPVKKAEIKRLKKSSASNRFAQLFQNKEHETIFIAEIKPKSPSAGQLIQGDPLLLVDAYEKGQASAISVLTDATLFGGGADLFSKIRERTKLPLLRKEFIIDESQLVESLQLGADAVLLIVQLVTPQQLKKLIQFSKQLGLIPLVEVITEAELKLAVNSGAEYIGVNSRDLRTMQIDSKRALSVVKKIPARKNGFLFSGIESADQVREAVKAGAKGVLIGTSLLQSNDPAKQLLKMKAAVKENHAH